MTYRSEIAGRSGKDFILEILEEDGPLLDPTPIDEGTLDQWRGFLPEILLDFWSNQGIGTLSNGMLRVCLPNTFDGLLQQIFHSDSDFSHNDCHLIGYSAFGKLFVWSERHWMVTVDLISALVSAPCHDPANKLNANASLITGLFRERDYLDQHDKDQKLLFKKAVKKLGKPGRGEAFGFMPALALGGNADLNNIRIVPALEHFSILAQLQPFNLISYLPGQAGLGRKIG